jgi:uncharacterized protein (TIGR00269 family)
MKCRRCPRQAVIEIRRHNAAYCPACFVDVVRGQIDRTIERHRMLDPTDRILVAVSGGKDSLALWDVLLDLGYDATGLYLGLGIGGYSDRSARVVREFAASRVAELRTVDLARDLGYDVPTAGRKGPRSTCAICGLSKRYVFNRAAIEGGYDVVATGHNLDDEAATLLGNTLRWRTDAIARQVPVLAAREGLVKKVKPLHRLSELETAAYAFIRGIDYVVEECPLVSGNTQLRYKEAMNAIERRSPGTKAQFLFGFLDRSRSLFADEDHAVLEPCGACGQPTPGPYCAFCRARAQILGERLGRPVEDRELADALSEEVLPTELYEPAGTGGS